MGYSIKTYMLTSSKMDGFVMFRAFPTWVHWENCHPWWEFCRGWRFCWIIFETSTSCSTVLYSKPPKQIENYNPNLKQWWFTFTFFKDYTENWWSMDMWYHQEECRHDVNQLAAIPFGSYSRLLHRVLSQWCLAHAELHHFANDVSGQSQFSGLLWPE